MRYPAIRDVRDVIRGAETCQAGLPDGRWVPARALGFMSLRERLRAPGEADQSGAAKTAHRPNAPSLTLPHYMREIISRRIHTGEGGEGLNMGECPLRGHRVLMLRTEPCGLGPSGFARLSHRRG